MKQTRGWTRIELMIAFGFLLVFAAFPMLALWTGRSLDFWLTHFKGHAVHVPYWIDVAITVCLNTIAIGANVVSEICRYLITL
jgi:hypothetical protein